MKLIKITLTLWFERSDTSDMMFAEDMEDVEKIESAFALMDDDETFNWQTYITKFDPKEFVKYVGSFDSEVKEAKWLPEGKIEYIIEYDEKCYFGDDDTDQSVINHVKNALLDESLEDGDYESSEENGWIIMTKPLADGTTYEYGLVDYRNEKNISVCLI
jgi:hypothetical protein